MPSVVQSLLDAFPPATFVVGMVLLILGGNWLVEGSATVARRLGVSPLVIGLTLVAFGTSAPELVFNVFSAADGHTDLSFGNIVGSNIANLGLILGIGGLVAPLVVAKRVARIELPLLTGITAGFAGLAYVSRIALDGVTTPGFGRLDGFIMLVVFGGFLVLWFRIEEPDAAEDDDTAKQWSTPIASLVALGGILALAAGGKAAESGAVGIASSFGVSQTVTGLTIVAIATSLPELVTVVIAARRGHSDLAVGNVVGSNVFNLLLVLPVTSIIRPVPIPDGGGIDLAVLVAITIACAALAMTNGRRIVRWQAAALLITYIVWIGWRTLF